MMGAHLLRDTRCYLLDSAVTIPNDAALLNEPWLILRSALWQSEIGCLGCTSESKNGWMRTAMAPLVLSFNVGNALAH